MDVPAPRTSHDTHRVADHISKLAFLFPLGLGGKSTRTRNFEDADFISITEVLRTLDLHSWGTIPRTYAVLRMINRIDDIDAFSTLKLSDLSIPYSKDNLPQSLSLSTKAKFMQEQVYVLTSSMDLERGESGGHKHISSLEDLQFERIADLGRGGGCTHVEKVWSNVGQKYYAVKYIRRAQYFQHDRKALKDFESELQNAKKVAHHHVVKIVGSFTEPRSVGIIMGTIGEQNLAQLLRGVVTSDTRSLLRTYFGCLASGLFAIHQADIKHKDIKPENVIIRKSVVYLTDFGLALDFSTTPENRSTTFGKPSVKHTPLYSAPEWWDYSRRDRRSDIWSLGAVYLEIATVLYKETIPNLFDFLGRHGTQNVLSYSRNMPGVREWIEILRSKQGHEKDTAAVDLTLATMKERIEERPTSYELWNLVEKFSPPDVSFACRACFECFNPSEKESEEVDPQPPITPENSSTLSASSRSTDITELSTTIETIASPSNSLLAQKQSLSVWDQFAENEKLSDIKTDNDENIYATKIDTRNPTNMEQLAEEAHGKGREIESGMAGSRSLNPISGDKPNVDKYPMEVVVHVEASMPEASASDPSKSTVEVPAKREISQSFRTFAALERQRVNQIGTNRARANYEIKLNDLKKFADSFKLQTPIPSDLIPIITNEPTTQKKIWEQKALRNAEDAKANVMKDSKILPENVLQIRREQDEQQSTTTAIRDQTYNNGNQTETMTTKSVREATVLTRLMALVESTKHRAIPAENGAGGLSISIGPWTIREDAQLIRAVHFSKPRNWQWISAVVGSRSQGQCKKRWKKVEVLFEDAEGTKKLIHVLEGSKSLGL